MRLFDQLYWAIVPESGGVLVAKGRPVGYGRPEGERDSDSSGSGSSDRGLFTAEDGRRVSVRVRCTDTRFPTRQPTARPTLGNVTNATAADDSSAASSETIRNGTPQSSRWLNTFLRNLTGNARTDGVQPCNMLRVNSTLMQVTLAKQSTRVNGYEWWSSSTQSDEPTTLYRTTKTLYDTTYSLWVLESRQERPTGDITQLLSNVREWQRVDNGGGERPASADWHRITRTGTRRTRWS